MFKEKTSEIFIKNCPNCGSNSTIPYAYGHMSEEAHKERAKKGEYVWGGCVIANYSPTDYCKDCEQSFGKRVFGRKPIQYETNIFKKCIRTLSSKF